MTTPPKIELRIVTTLFVRWLEMPQAFMILGASNCEIVNVTGPNVPPSMAPIKALKVVGLNPLVSRLFVVLAAPPIAPVPIDQARPFGVPKFCLSASRICCQLVGPCGPLGPQVFPDELLPLLALWLLPPPRADMAITPIRKPFQ